jgi:hypothetical protein
MHGDTVDGRPVVLKAGWKRCSGQAINLVSGFAPAYQTTAGAGTR